MKYALKALLFLAIVSTVITGCHSNNQKPETNGNKTRSYGSLLRQ